MGILDWGFRASLQLHTVKPEESVKINDKTTFHEFVHKDVPLIDTQNKLWLNPLLFNGTLQTLYYAMHKSEDKFQVYYGRELFKYSDGGQASLDWVMPKPESKEQFKKLYEETIPEDSPKLHPRTRFFTKEELELRQNPSDSESTEPICFVLHGLAGGSHEPLIRNLGEYLGSHISFKWDVVVINSRGCCRTKITTGKLFSAFSTDDVKDVLLEIRRRYPKRPIYGIGFSFGGCILSNLLGSEDPEIEGLIKAAVVIGCPWDLADSAYHVDSSLTGRKVLNPGLTTFLNKLIKANKQELQSFLPEFFTDERIEQAKWAIKTYEWDNAFTCKTVGFSNAFQYYREGSPLRRIHKIKTPLLAINSTDDPAVSCRLPIQDFETNPYLALVESNLGGHLGFVKYSGEFWCVEAADEFINKFEEATRL